MALVIYGDKNSIILQNDNGILKPMIFQSDLIEHYMVRIHPDMQMSSSVRIEDYIGEPTGYVHVLVKNIPPINDDEQEGLIVINRKSLSKLKNFDAPSFVIKYLSQNNGR